MSIARLAVRTAFRGLRTGDAPLLVLGSVFAIYIWRRGRSDHKTTAHTLKLAAGQSIGMRVTGRNSAPQEFVVR